MERRGRLIQASKDMPNFMQERVLGKHDFEYDINQNEAAREVVLPVNSEDPLADGEALESLQASLLSKDTDAAGDDSKQRSLLGPFDRSPRRETPSKVV